MSESLKAQDIRDQERRRGMVFSSFLTLAFIVSIFLFFLHAWLYAAGVPDMRGLPGSEGFSAMEKLTVPFMNSEMKLLAVISLDLLNLVFLLGIWKLKKWAVYGLCASVVFAYGINILFLIPTYFDLLGVAGLLALIFFILPRWRSFQ